jgi:hypothetical protein
MEKKQCTICYIEQPILNYNIFYNTKKLKSFCKTCDKNKRNKNDIKYRENNKEIIKTNVAKYRENNKENVKLSDKKYRENNKEKIRIKNKNWRDKPHTELYYIKNNVSKGIMKSIKRKGYTKKSRTLEILGCTYEEFKLYIESRFESWMTWENMGNPKDGKLELNKTWDIDHIIPLATATNEEELLKLNHYTNLQPLCSYINRFIKRDN